MQGPSLNRGGSAKKTNPTEAGLRNPRANICNGGGNAFSLRKQILLGVTSECVSPVGNWDLTCQVTQCNVSILSVECDATKGILTQCDGIHEGQPHR